MAVPTSEELFAATQFVVQATGTEVQLLWEIHARQALYPTTVSVLDWEQINPGYVVQVGQIAGFPVNISCRWGRIDGVLVLFWEGISRVVDYQMCEEWLERHCAPRWDGGRMARTNAMNFHHVRNFAREYNPNRRT